MVINKKTREIETHFNKTTHTLSDLSFQCIDQAQASSDSDRIDKLFHFVQSVLAILLANKPVIVPLSIKPKDRVS